MPDGGRLTRVLLTLLALSAVVGGVWAAVSPRSFFTDFPGAGHHWVAVDGPYNEHLVRDVGHLFLGLTVVAVAAIIRPTRALVLTAAVAFFVEGLPHLVYHSRHLDLYSTGDQIGNVVALSIGVVVPAVLVARLVRRERPAALPAAISSSTR